MDTRQQVCHSNAASSQHAAAVTAEADDPAATKRSSRQGIRRIGPQHPTPYLQPRAHERERLHGLAQQAQAQQRGVPQV